MSYYPLLIVKAIGASVIVGLGVSCVLGVAYYLIKERLKDGR